MADKRIADLFDKPISFASPDHPDDVILEASDSELSEGSLRRKHDAIEHAAKEYLKGRVPFLLSAQLKGTITKGGKEWASPWRKKSRVQKPQLKSTKLKDTTIYKANGRLPKLPEALTQLPLADRAKSNERPKDTREKQRADRGQVRESLPFNYIPVAEDPGDEINSFDESGPSRTAPQPRTNRVSTAVPARLNYFPPPSYHSNASAAATLPGRTEETWLKRKSIPKKVWEGPDGGTPTPKSVTPEPTIKRKRRPPIDRTSSLQSTQANGVGIAQKLQDRQRSERSSFNSDLERKIPLYRTQENPKVLSLRRNVSARSTPAREDDTMNTIVRASAGKRMSIADRQQDSTLQDEQLWSEMHEGQQSTMTQDRQTDSMLQNRQRFSMSHNRRPYSTVQDRQKYTMADYSFDFTNSVDDAVDSELETPNPITTARRVNGKNLDESSALADFRAGNLTQSPVDSELESSNDTRTAQRVSPEKNLDGYPAFVDLQAEDLIQSPVTTPFSPQLGSFSKYQLGLPKFDFGTQLQKSDSGGFDFSFRDAINSQLPQPSIEYVSRPTSPVMQQKSNSAAPPLSQNIRPLLPEVRASSTTAVPDPKFKDNSFLFSRVQKAGQKSREPLQTNAETQQGRQTGDKRNDGRLRRSMAFEEDPSPGFLGPRQKRHREKTKLRNLQTQELRESSDSSSMKADNIPKTNEPIVAFQPIQTWARGTSIRSEPKRDHQIVVEPPKMTLSSVIRVNLTEDPGVSENPAEIEETESFQSQRITRSSQKQPKFVMSAIISEHISPEKPSSPPLPEEIDVLKAAVTCPLPPKVSTISRESPVKTNVTRSKSKSKPSVSFNLPSPHLNLEPHSSRSSHPSTPSQSSKSKQTSPDKDLASRSTKSPPTPMLLDEVSDEHPQVSQEPVEDEMIEEADEDGDDETVRIQDFADQHQLDVGTAASENEQSQALASKSETPASSRKASDIGLPNKQVPSKSHSQPANSRALSHPQSTNSSQSRSPLFQDVNEATVKNVSQLPPASSSDSQVTQAKAWSFNDTTLSLSPSGVDSSTPMVSPHKGRAPLGRSGLSNVNSRMVEENEESIPSANEPVSTPVPVQDERKSSSENTPRDVNRDVHDAEGSMSSSAQVQSSRKGNTVNLEKGAREVSPDASDVEQLLSSLVQAESARGSPAVFSENKEEPKGKTPIRPTIVLEDIEISSDDSEEDIPSSRPVPILDLRNSFLSPLKKVKSTEKQRRRKSGKIYKSNATSSSKPQTPRRSQRFIEQPISVAKSPIQAIDEDPMTQNEARLYAEFEAEPQSPWNLDTEVTVPPILPIPTFKTPINNTEDVSNPNTQARSSTSSRVPSDLQTGWDESGLDSATSYAPNNKSYIALDSETSQREPISPHDTSYELNERESTPPVSSSPPRLVCTSLSPPRQQDPPPESPEAFPNTQALIDAAIKNPWASTSTSSFQKSRSKKRVSFATDNDDEDSASLPSIKKSGKRRKLMSPPPASDDSIGIDGPDDKLARRLRAVTTLKVGGRKSLLPIGASSSPPADAMAQAFVDADALQITGATTSKGKRKLQYFNEDGPMISSQPNKKQYRPSQASYVDDDDEEEEEKEEGASSSEITADGRVIPRLSQSKMEGNSPVPSSTSLPGFKRNESMRRPRNEDPRAILGDDGEEEEEDIAALVEQDPDKVLGDLESFLQGWDVEEEVRKVGGGRASTSVTTSASTPVPRSGAMSKGSSTSGRKKGGWLGIY